MPEIKKVLILLATYNGAKYIKKQLETILSQKNVETHVLISDDCSTDNTIKIVNQFSNENIMLINSTKKFGSASSNFFYLVENADIQKFQYIAFADQDDIWNYDKLAYGIDELVMSGSDGLSSDVIAYWPENNKKKLLKKSFPQKKYDFFFEGPGPGCSQIFTQSSFKIFQNFVIQNKSNLDTIDYHDWLTYAFYRYNNLKWFISKEPKMLYRQHEENQIGANSGLIAKFDRINKIKNSWYKEQVVNTYKLISSNEFEEFIKNENLISKPLSLRRKLSHSIVIWFLILFKIFER